MGDVDLSEILGWIVAVTLILERVLKGSHAVPTQENCDKQYAILHKRIDCGDEHDEQQDKALHAIHIVQAEACKDMRYFGDSMNNLAESVKELIADSRHMPECQIASQRPQKHDAREWPEHKTGRYNLTDSQARRAFNKTEEHQ